MATIITKENGQIECQNEMLKMNRKTGENEYTQLTPVESCEGITLNNNNLVMANSRYDLPHIQLESLTVADACEELADRVFKGGRIFTKMTGATTEIQTILDESKALDIVFWRNKYYGLFKNLRNNSSYVYSSSDGKVFDEYFASWGNGGLHEMVVYDNRSWFCGRTYWDGAIHSRIYYIISPEDKTLHYDYTAEDYTTEDTSLDYPCHIATDGTTLFAMFVQYSDYKTKVVCKNSVNGTYSSMIIDTSQGETLHSRPCVFASALYIAQFDTAKLSVFTIGSNGTLYKNTISDKYANIRAISRSIDSGGNFFYAIQDGTDYISQFSFTTTIMVWTTTSNNEIQKYGNNFDMIFFSPLYIYNAFDNETQEYRCYYGEKKYDNQLNVDCRPVLFKGTDIQIQELNMLQVYNNKVFGIGSKDSCLYYSVYE
jgi:hypothetical protein